MPRALVTGGSGFVGSHLIKALLDRGWEVNSLDVMAPPPNVRADVRATWREADLMAQATLGAYIEWESADVVFHLAAAPWNVARDDEFIRINTFGTLQALQIANSLGARFILASSMMVYGNALHTPFEEWDTPRPYSPYAYSKWLAEELVRHFAEQYGVPAIILRCANIYGPGQERYRHLIPDLLRQLVTNKDGMTLRGTGKETRDFVYVDDAILAYLAVASAAFQGCLSCNVGTGIPTTISEVAERLLAEFSLWRSERGMSLWAPRYTGKTGPHDTAQQPLALRAERLGVMGWHPTVALSEGLSRTAAAFRALPDALRRPVL